MKFINGFYSKILYLYPPDYQKQFRDEQLGVFENLIQDSEKNSWWQTLKCFGKECIALPGGILNAYLDSIGGKNMFTPKKIIGINTLNFAIAFGLLALEYFFLRYKMNAELYQTNLVFQIIWVLIAGMIFGLSGWVVALSVSAKNKLHYVIAFGGGFVVSTIMTSPTIWAAFGLKINGLSTSFESFLIYCSALIQGLVIGHWFGWVWKGWKVAPLYAIAGGLIFELGYWVNYLVLMVLNNVVLKWLPSIDNFRSVWILVTWVMAYLFFGTVIGSLWGVLVSKTKQVILHPIN